MDLELILLVTFSLHLDLTTESSDVNKREMQQPKLGWNSPHSASFLPKQWGSANNFGSLPSNTSHALRFDFTRDLQFTSPTGGCFINPKCGLNRRNCLRKIWEEGMG